MRAALHAEIAAALGALYARRGLDDESVHAVRQALKRGRAALRLLRDGVAEAAYARENAALREAAAPLAAARDPAVMLGILEEMIADRKMRAHRPALVRLRTRAREARAQGLANGVRSAGKMRSLLERSRDRTARWRMPRDPEPLYWSGLRRTYAAGSEALERVRAKGTAAALHEWRKQVKYLAASLAFMARGNPHGAKAARLARELGKALGDDHDLAVLAAALRRVRADAELLAQIEQRRRKLQKRALKLGQRLYKRSPERFAARLHDI